MLFKVEEETKEKFDAFAKEIGISSSGLLNIFVKRVADEQRIPFVVTTTSNDKKMADNILSHYDLSNIQPLPVNEEGFLDPKLATNEADLDWLLNG